MIIYLIGYMGSGKSTIARNLSNKLSYSTVDLDKHIEEQEQKSVTQIFATLSEEHFRDLETRYLKELSIDKDVVVSVGGGTPCFNGNMNYMKSTGLVIYLRQSVDTLCDRLLHSHTPRPLIVGKTKEELRDYILDSLSKREPFYEQANIIIDNPARDAHKIKEIIEYYAEYPQPNIDQ